MTIATRNRFIKLATIIALVFAIITIPAIIVILIKHNIPEIIPGPREALFLDHFLLTTYSPTASIAAIGIFPIFSLLGLLYILFAFEKTQTIEITFFASCVFALSLETLRLLIPLFQLWIHGSFYTVTISRFVFFSRIFTILALLSSALFATGNTIQQIGPSIFLLSFFSFSLANAIPLSLGNMGSNFLVVSGYKEMLRIFFGLIGMLSVVSYAILGETKKIPEYTRSSLGLLLFLPGYSLLSTCDSWLFFTGGSIFLFLGAWLYLKPMHQYYLWQ